MANIAHRCNVPLLGHGEPDQECFFIVAIIIGIDSAVEQNRVWFENARFIGIATLCLEAEMLRAAIATNATQKGNKSVFTWVILGVTGQLDRNRFRDISLHIT